MAVDEIHRNRAAGLLLASEMVLLQRKETDSFWALPGGGIEHGESAQQALVRELREELDWVPAELRLFCVAESLFTHGNQLIQQYGFYFSVRADALWRQQNCPPAHQEFRGQEAELVFQWCRQAKLATIAIRPTALVPVFAQPPSTVLHCASGFGD